MFISGREGWVRDSVRVLASGVTMAWARWAKSTGPECRGLGVPLKIKKKTIFRYGEIRTSGYQALECFTATLPT